MTHIDKGVELVQKWAERFGFGHWHYEIHLINQSRPAWAESHFHVEEEWFSIWLPPDDLLPFETLELLVLHELAHGLLHVAAASDYGTEVVCNRIARAAKGDYGTPFCDEHMAQSNPAAYYREEDQRDQATVVSRRDWLHIVAKALPEKEREVIELLYFSGMSLREAGEVLGVSYETVRQWRKKALETMRTYFDRLDERFGQ